MTKNPLTEKVERDPNLSGSEKETTISMYGDGKKYLMYSAKPTIVKSLLRHDYFEMEWARVIEEGSSSTTSDLNDLEETEGKIVSIKGFLPVGTLTVKSKPRANNHQSSIVSTEGIDPSVFGDE